MIRYRAAFALLRSDNTEMKSAAKPKINGNIIEEASLKVGEPRRFQLQE